MISYIGHESQQCRRMACRLGFHFHINECNNLIEHAGWKSEERPATEIELAMWERLTPPDWKAGETLDLTREELDGTCPRLGDCYYVGSEDFARMRMFLEADLECNPDLVRLREGWFGTYKEARFYVTSLIPKGYHYRTNTLVPELIVRPDPGLDLQVESVVNYGLTPW